MLIISVRKHKLTYNVHVQSAIPRTSCYSPPGYCTVPLSGQAELLRRRRAAELVEEAALLPGDVLPERLYRASLRLDGADHPLFSHQGEVSPMANTFTMRQR